MNWLHMYELLEAPSRRVVKMSSMWFVLRTKWSAADLIMVQYGWGLASTHLHNEKPAFTHLSKSLSGAHHMTAATQLKASMATFPGKQPLHNYLATSFVQLPSFTAGSIICGFSSSFTQSGTAVL